MTLLLLLKAVELTFSRVRKINQFYVTAILAHLVTSENTAVRHLGVEGEHALVVPSDEQSWWEVSGENVQPRHVEVVGHGLFTGDGHAPVWGGDVDVERFDMSQ